MSLPTARFPFDKGVCAPTELLVGPYGSGSPAAGSAAAEREQVETRVPTSNVAGRIAAILALVAAPWSSFLVLLGPGGSSYTVTAKFENASQLVKGNPVKVAGVSAGTIKEISLGDDGQAEVELEVSEDYAPLPAGHPRHGPLLRPSRGSPTATSTSTCPPARTEAEEIEDGGMIEQVNTTSEVDLDQLFNTLDEPTVTGLKSVIKGFARSYDGVGQQANRGFYYLNPFLSTSRRVFGELNSDQRALESLIVDGASLTEALASRSGDLEALVGNLNGMLGTIGAREAKLASAIGQLPDFMRQFNTTAVNLRAALDDVDPLIDGLAPGGPQAAARSRGSSAASPATPSRRSRASTASSSARARPTT